MIHPKSIHRLVNYIVYDPHYFEKDFPPTVLKIENTHRGYNQTTHQVRLIDGQWPTDEDLGKRFGSNPYCGGHTVTGSGDEVGSTRSIKVWGCD